MKKLVSLLVALLLVMATPAMAAATLSPLGEYPLVIGDPATLTILMEGNNNITDYEENSFTQFIEESLNVSLDFTLLPAGEADSKLSIMVNSGEELPDVINHPIRSLNTTYSFAQAGAIIPVNDLYEQYSVKLKPINEAHPEYYIIKAITAPDGNFYSIPEYRSELGNHTPFRMFINTTWLEQLNLEKPTTTEEFYNVLKAFKDNAAELVGEGVPFWPMGACSSTRGISDIIFDVFASENGLVAEWNVVGDELVYHINMPGYKNTLATLRKFYQDGLIDPEYPLMSRDDMLEKWYQNAYGSWLFYLDNSDPNLGSWAKTYYGYYPEAKIGAVTAFPDAEGVARIDGAFEKQMFVVFKDCKNPEAVMKLLNYLVTPEGVDLVQMGIKGVDWTEDENGKVTVNDVPAERKEKLGYKSYYLWMMDGYLTPARCYDPSVIEIGERQLKTAVTPIVLNATETYLDAGTTLKDLEKTYATRLIVEADIDFDAVFDEFVTKWNEAGGAQWTVEYNEQYKATQK